MIVTPISIQPSSHTLNSPIPSRPSHPFPTQDKKEMLKILANFVGSGLVTGYPAELSLDGLSMSLTLQVWEWFFHQLYRNKLKNRKFDKEAPEDFDPERMTIAVRQGMSEDRTPRAKPTSSNSCFYWLCRSFFIFCNSPQTGSYALGFDTAQSMKTFLKAQMINQMIEKAVA